MAGCFCSVFFCSWLVQYCMYTPVLCVAATVLNPCGALTSFSVVKRGCQRWDGADPAG
jgi:hypothetical protein